MSREYLDARGGHTGKTAGLLLKVIRAISAEEALAQSQGKHRKRSRRDGRPQAERRGPPCTLGKSQKAFHVRRVCWVWVCNSYISGSYRSGGGAGRLRVCAPRPAHKTRTVTLYRTVSFDNCSSSTGRFYSGMPAILQYLKLRYSGVQQAGIGHTLRLGGSKDHRTSS